MSFKYNKSLKLRKNIMISLICDVQRNIGEERTVITNPDTMTTGPRLHSTRRC